MSGLEARLPEIAAEIERQVHALGAILPIFRASADLRFDLSNEGTLGPAARRSLQAMAAPAAARFVIATDFSAREDWVNGPRFFVDVTQPFEIDEPRRPDDFWSGGDLADFLGIHPGFAQAVPVGALFMGPGEE